LSATKKLDRGQIMAKEIDMLREANRQGCLVVDKDSNRLLEETDLTLTPPSA
jgi:hypothetical protein